MRKKSDLRAYQDRLVTHLYEHDAVQVVAGMGSGKTAVGLTAVAELINDKVIRCAFVLAPRLVAQLVWPNEPHEWEHLHNMYVSHVTGDAAEREKLLLTQGAHVYTIGIHHLPWLVKFLKTLPEDHYLFDCLVIDESSKLKAPRGKWGRALMGICRRWRIKWWMSGTPRPNGYQDMFRPLAILTGGKIWGTTQYDKWLNKHFISDYQGYNWTIRPESEAKLIRKAASVTIAIDDAEMPELPPLQNVFHWVDLPPAARKVYAEMEAHMVAKWSDSSTVLAANAAVATGKLAQIAQGFMYDKQAVDGKVVREVQHIHTLKADILVEKIEELNGLPALIAYEFKEDLDVIRAIYPDMPFMGNGVSSADAETIERAWNAKKLPLLALHPASAAHGLNLQFGGQQLLIYGMPWSAELYDQLIKRFYRPGQTEHCFVHHILARGTVDEVKYDRVIGKMDDQTAFKRYLRKV